MEMVDVRSKLARHPSKTYGKRPMENIKYIVIHHSGTIGGDSFSFARFHVNTRGWPGIGYHYVILKDGTIQYTNDLSTISYHTVNYNSQSVGICLVGDFTREELSQAQKEALKSLNKELVSRLNLKASDIKGHNELATTLCPGLNMDGLRQHLITPDLTIYLNGKKLDLPTLIQDNVTYVALRNLSQELGIKVMWEEESRSIFLESDDDCKAMQEERNGYLLKLKKIKDLVKGV